MRNIIKSQLYQFSKERIPFITLFCITAFITAVKIITDTWDIAGTEPVTGGSCFADTLMQSNLLSLLFVVISVSFVCGNDFTDKTTNHELLAGHLRRDVFFGRAVTSIIVGTSGWLLMTLVPIIAMTIKNGWGTQILIGDALFRLFLMLFPVIRIICEIAMLCFIVKNPFISMTISWISILTLGMASETIGEGHLFLGTSNLFSISVVDTWMNYGLSDGTNYFIYDMTLPSGDIIGTIAASVIFGAAALYIGYTFFRNDDMN